MLDQIEQKAYRAYVTDALKAIAENTARYAGGSYLNERYVDRIQRRHADHRSGEEIAADIIKKCGLKVVS